jgi:hypothetical protein
MNVRSLSVIVVGLVVISVLLALVAPAWPAPVLTAFAGPPAHPGIAPAAQDPQATPALPMVNMTADAIVRAWPSPSADSLGVIPSRSSVPASGRLVDFTWWQIPFSAGPGGYAWLAATVLVPNDAAASVPVIQVIMPTPAQPTATPTPPPPPSCTLDAAFVADVTIPDGTIMPPAQPAHKVWRMRNTGTCAWDAGTLLKFVSGFQMGAPMTATFAATQPGQTADIGVTAYAPSQPGVYRGIWQLQDQGINLFGPQITMVVQVVKQGPPAPPAPPRPQPTPLPGPSVNFWSDATRVDSGRCTVIHWAVNNVQAVYLQYRGQTRGVAGQGSQTVCPLTDGQDYALRIVRLDGSQDARYVHIDVKSPPPGPVSINFWANPTFLLQTNGSACTTVGWAVQNASRVDYQGHGVVGNDSRRECPQKTTTYRLRVTDRSGKAQDRSVTVTVKWGGIVTPGPMPGPVYPTPRPPMPGPVYPTVGPMPGPVYPTEEPPMPGPVYPTEEPMPGPVYPDNDDSDGG